MEEPMPVQPSGEAVAAGADEESVDFDVEAALLALSEDLSGPTVPMDLSALSPTERRIILDCLRERFGLGVPPGPPE
jgi:hypothetical protein